ncbi:MAG: ABC transporter substrate-binding protein [Burkholderiales bacterium]
MKLTQISAACALAATTLFTASAQAQISGDTVKIGFITDLSGLYADIDGPAGAEAIRMAIADFGGTVGGKKIELLVADHQNKPDVAASKAREWIDQQGLDMLIGGTNSGTALAMAKVTAEKKKPFVAIGPGSSALTSDQCTPYTIHYAYDTVALAKGTGPAVVKAGGKSWYFLTADYAFGTALQADATAAVTKAGGTVVGSVRAPLASSDFSSFLLQAQASKAQILGLANAGGDTINSIKAANEFGITKTMKLAGLLMFINDVHSLGLKATQGMYLTDSWYWNQSAESRAWAKRFFDKFKRMPSSLQAADYSATMFYLNAVKAIGSDDGDKTNEQMRKSKVNDMYAKGGYIRADGTMVHDMFLLQVKTPAQSTTPWDYFNVVATTKGEDAFLTKAESKCALWK